MNFKKIVYLFFLKEEKGGKKEKKKRKTSLVFLATHRLSLVVVNRISL